MNSLLFENPFLVGVIGTIVFAMTIFGWLQTGNPGAGGASIAVAAITAFLLWLNVWIETDRESVRAMLSVAASEVEQNQLEKLKSRVHPEATERVHLAMSQLPGFKFEQAKITQIHAIDFHMAAARKVAFVRMNVIADAESKGGSTAGVRGKLAAWIQLELEQMDGKWRVVDCERKGPQHEFLRHAE
ncbi:MAG: hypothetical protein ACK56W_11060 [Pirellula sp.]|jgi:hypothetical protein